MNKRITFLSIAVGVTALALASASRADEIKIGAYSQEESSSHASAGASISTRTSRPARGGRPRADAHSSSTRVISVLPPGGRAGSDYPTLSPDSPLLRNPQPLGPNTFWYPDGSGHACVFMVDGSPLCYTVTGGNGASAEPEVNPAAIAAAIAARLDLFPGRIHASPSSRRGGLTGVDSWFWLSPPPTREVLSISLAGERVSVSAVPSVEWRFGDGASLLGGAGSPYVPGPPPADAIRHLYQTRCLPGDTARNPYVLASCGARGYPLEAVVHWAISFEASGPVDASGSLPSRTTSTGIAYLVSEARAFLVGGGYR